MKNLDEINRRKFIKFVSSATAVTTLGGCWPFSSGEQKKANSDNLPFEPIFPSSIDDVILSKGLQSEVLISFGDMINSKAEKFGYNNDFIAFISVPDRVAQGWLWVNHEYTHPLLIGGSMNLPKSKLQVDLERKNVGGSLIHIKKREKGWEFVNNSRYSFRIDNFTRIPFSGGVSIAGSDTAIGTLSNCGGGVTPWNTFLTCEENYHKQYGDIDFLSKEKVTPQNGWSHVYPFPPEHYGWVVEVQPREQKAEKLVQLGRFAHESATVTQAKDGRAVVYMGDDKEFECLYKFISDSKSNLETGVLYVANLEKKSWIPIDIEKSPKLKKYFSNQIEVLTFARHAASILEGTKLDRPEDIVIHPKTKEVFVALTGSSSSGRPHGSLLKVMEDNQDPGSLTFSSNTFLLGGTENGFSNPDNLAFDKHGNLWICTDMSSMQMNNSRFSSFKNNGLFFVPTSGKHAGKAIQVASAPTDAEFTGPCFSPDGETLFLSVQHPGETSRSLSALSSHWPRGGNATPKPCVIKITGETLSKYIQQEA